MKKKKLPSPTRPAKAKKATYRGSTPRRKRGVGYKDTPKKKSPRLALSENAKRAPDTPEHLAAAFVSSAKDGAAKCVKELRRSVTQLEKGHRQQLWARAVGVYASASEMKSDAKEWKTFINRPFWSNRKRPHVAKPETALRFIVEYVFQEAGYERQRQYLRALEYLEHKGVEPEDAFQEIADAGGLDPLADMAVKETPRQAKRNAAAKNKANPVKVANVDDDDDPEDEDDLVDGKEKGGLGGNSTDAGEHKPALPRPGKVHMTIEMDQDTFDAILETDNLVTVKLTPELLKNGWYRVSASILMSY